MKWTQQLFEEWVEKNRPEYEVADTFVDVVTKMEMRHKACNRTWLITPHKFKLGRGCRHCFGKRKLTTEQFAKWLEDNRPDYEVVGEYIDDSTKIPIKHKTCGTIWDIKPNTIKNGTGCTTCYGTPKIEHGEFVHWMSIHRPNHEVIGTYITNKIKITLRHKPCNLVWDVLPTQIKKSDMCPNCYGNMRWTPQQFLTWAETHCLEYTILEPYVNHTTKIRVQHNICGKVCKRSPGSLKSGYGCRYCGRSMSKAEKALFAAIQAHYPDAIDNIRGLLPTKSFELDIYIPSIDKAIEFNGEYWHLRDDKAIRRDARKKQQCQEQSIDLFVVWYNDWAQNQDAAIQRCLTFLGGE